MSCLVEWHWQMQFPVDNLHRSGLGSLLAGRFGPQATFNFVKRVCLLKHINNNIKSTFLRICDMMVNIYVHTGWKLIFFLLYCAPRRAIASSFLRCLDHSQRRTTVNRTLSDEWSAPRRDLYLKTHNNHKWQTSMILAGFEPTIQEGKDRSPTTYTARPLGSAYRSFGTRVSPLKIWHFWVTGIERNVCRCIFSRYSVITQFEKLAAEEQSCLRCTHRKVRV